MKQILFLLLTLLALSTILFAQAEELPELDAENLRESWLQRFYQDMETAKPLLKANGRLSIHEDDTNALLSFRLFSNGLRLHTNLYYNDPDYYTGNFTLSRLTPKENLREIHIGSLRPTWGLGAVFARNNSSDALLKLQNAPHPKTYSPLGASVVYSQGEVSGFFLASHQNRRAYFSESLISSLPKSRDDALSRTAETIVSGGVLYEPDKLALGAMLYYQNYDHDFVQEDYARVLDAISLSAKLQGESFNLGAEAALIEGKYALQARADLLLPRLEQSLSFSYRAGKQLPAYASRPFILSGEGDRHELSWDLDYTGGKDTRLGFRQALSAKNKAIQSPKWLSRSIVYVQYKPDPALFLLQLTRFDKEIITQSDASYVNTLPVHYRGRFLMQQGLSKYLSLQVNLRYHYESKQQAIKNAIHWDNTFRYAHKALSLECGLKSWQSSHSILIPDDQNDSEEGVFVSSGDGFDFFVAPSLKWKTLRLKAQMQQSFRSGERNFLFSAGF